MKFVVDGDCAAACGWCCQCVLHSIAELTIAIPPAAVIYECEPSTKAENDYLWGNETRLCASRFICIQYELVFALPVYMFAL